MISCYVDITSVLQPKAELKESANTHSCTVLKRFLLALTVLEKSLHNFTLTSTKELVEKPKELSVITLEWTENPPGMSFVLLLVASYCVKTGVKRNLLNH